MLQQPKDLESDIIIKKEALHKSKSDDSPKRRAKDQHSAPAFYVNQPTQHPCISVPSKMGKAEKFGASTADGYSIARLSKS